MGLHWLKWLRVGVSTLFFTLIALVFLDFRNMIPASVGQGILFLQFAPSLLQFLITAALGATGWVIVVVLTVLLGRVYCSTICPLGTFQDLTGYVARKKEAKKRFEFSRPHNGLRYGILTLTVILFVFGNGFLLNLLDPFSGFGRILSNIVRPAVLALNNGAAILLEAMGVHSLYLVHWGPVAPLSVAVALATMALVIWLSARRGRLYCNTVCPVGALLGLLSRFSFLRIGIDPDSCRGCRACERACKAGCINLETKTVDVGRCVACYNCLAVCRDKALRFEVRWPRRSSGKGLAMERRGFILNSALWVAGVSGFGEQTRKIVQARPTTIPIPMTGPVSPPGSKSVKHFTSTCTACHLCVSACPTRVLAPSLLEYGFFGMMQPRMDFHSGFCNFECTVCLNICPSGAILPLAPTDKKLTQLGVATFIKENCVVHTDKTDCGACSEHCPTKAVRMVPYPNPAEKPLVIPEVKSEYCIGCGACEFACPTKPFKAIYVEAKPIHKLATKPATETIDETIVYDDDFPF
ncbi:MAG: 4Fe-4S dicluster domain-containing protein [Deltaproteobacteria bacterium]|nr:4Fe-4S dicluster domain-containing protein [Deltaproteobacteria bacterium]